MVAAALACIAPFPGFASAAPPAATPKTGADRTPKATVEMIADQAALTPGRSVTLALRFTLEKDWHIYWRNAGTAGMPPSARWKLPPGFAAGPLQFPAPKRYSTPAGDSFILEGRPALLLELKVPEDAPVGKDVEIAGTITWLICKESCIREKQDVALTLPVQAKDAEARPANEPAFRAARRFLPVPAAEANYLTLTTAASVDRLRPGDEAKAAVVLDIRDGHHIQSNKPLSAAFVATDIFTDDIAGLTLGHPQFPPDKRRNVPELGEVAEFAGRVVIILPVKANPDLAGPEVRVTGVLTYQACDDKTGQCFLPESLEWSLSIPVGDANGTVKTTHPDIFGTAAAGAPASRAAEREAAQIGATAGGFTLDRAVVVHREQAERPLWLWIVLAVVAGLLLNVTPCVLPVISIKVLSFVQQAQESPARVLRLGLAFAAGMMLVVNILAFLATGANLVWGQHFQRPEFVIAMAAIIFAFGLSLFGVFEFGVPRAIEEAAGRQEREGYLGSFAKGALATALGTPCLGPVLGAVLTWAVSQPTAVVFLVFNAIGVGMAAPYVLLTANPRWLRFVPRPGPWMETFKHIMGFVLMATVVYLLSIIQGQSGPGVVSAAALLVGVGAACWIWGRFVTPDSTTGGRVVVGVVALGILVACWLTFVRPAGRTASIPQAAVAPHGRIPWEPFSLARLEQLTAEGKTVMVDVTAEWCLNCKYNLKFVFDTDEVARTVQELGVVPLIADWTGYDEDIGRFIQKLAPGASIPLLAIFPAGRPTEPTVLLGLLTKDQVLAEIANAARSR